MPHSSRIRLVLAGGGHAHLEIIRRFHLERPPHIELIVVSEPRHHYSGMVPGYLRGIYTEAQISFDLAAITSAAGGQLVAGRATRLLPGKRMVQLASGRRVEYDLLSLAVGSLPLGGQRPEVSRHAVLVKPLSRIVKLRRHLLERTRSATQTLHVVVVGGGAAGIEIALAVAAVIDAAGTPRQVSIIEAGGNVLSGYSGRFRRRAEAILARRAIAVMPERRVEAVEADCLLTAGGARIISDLTIWLTGAVAQPFLRESGLAVDQRGFLLVDDALRSVSDHRVFAAGDCATVASQPHTPKAGVYAVRQGPVLWESLKAAAAGTSPPRYDPQPNFLSILNTADGKALLRYKTLVSHSVWAWQLKDRIDRRFVRKYQDLAKLRTIRNLF